jgi:hypothetical protein
MLILIIKDLKREIKRKDYIIDCWDKECKEARDDLSDWKYKFRLLSKATGKIVQKTPEYEVVKREDR